MKDHKDHCDFVEYVVCVCVCVVCVCACACACVCVNWYIWFI